MTEEYFRENLFKGKGSKTIFGRIVSIEPIEDDELSVTRRISVSLMTKKMFELDIFAMTELGRERNDYERYHPYFYEFFCDESDERRLEIAQRIYEEDRENEI